MASRRSGYDSLVRRHQLQALLSRSFDASDGDHSDAGYEPGQVGEMAEGGAKHARAYGNEDLGRIASAIEESVPWSSGILDIFWPKVEAASGPSTGDDGSRPDRPRPPRETTDLTEVTKKRQAHEEEQRMQELAGKAAEEKRKLEEKDRRERQMESEAMERSIEFAATIERMRAMFFGRPSQQIRLLKRDCQIERNKAEHYCSVWKHLMEDSEEECKEQNDIIRRATKQKSEAAARADSLRGKEKGARQAAVYLKGCQLYDASEKSRIAADKFGAEAAEEEQKARVARAELEDAEENKLIELEKIRACSVQIAYNKKLAKKALDEAIQREREEIKAVMDEEEHLTKARPTFNNLLANNAPLSTLAKSYQDDIDKIDRRLALLAMEQEMFCPCYLFSATSSLFKSSSSVKENIYVVAKAQTVPANGKKLEIREKPFDWKEFEQTPGTVCFGRRGVEENGLLFQRSIVVKDDKGLRNPFKNKGTFNEQFESLGISGDKKMWSSLVIEKLFNEDPDKKEETKIMKDDAQEKWNNLGRENLTKMQKSVSITSDYFAKDDLFISRGQSKGEPPRTLLDKKLFGRMWEQKMCITARVRLHNATKAHDVVRLLEEKQENHSHEPVKDPGEPSHEPEPRSNAPGSSNIVKLDRVNVRLRHCPKQLWLTTYAQTGKETNKPAFSVLNNNSLMGPKLSGYVPVTVPQLHERDNLSDGIDDFDGRPRRYAIVWNVLQPFNSEVDETNDLIELRVFDERKMTLEMRNEAAANKKNGPKPTREWEFESITIKSPAKGRFTGICPAVWKQKERTKKDDPNSKLFDWNQLKTHGYLDHTWIAGENSKDSNDLLHNYNLKVFSFEKIAFIEQGEDNWEARLLPVSEWPDIFFKDFNHFFVR